MSKHLFWKIVVIAATISSTCSIYAQFGGGTGTAADPWVISRAQHLDGIRGNYLSGHFIQTENIDLEEYLWDEGRNDYINGGRGWISIGDERTPFYGYYDGNGHVIDNLYINNPTTDYQGLFGYLNRGSIKNLGVTNADVVGAVTSAVLVGHNNGTVSFCYVTGDATVDSQGGGLLGMNLATVTNCWSSCNVTAQYAISSNIGGLLGYSMGAVSNSFSTGTVRSGSRSVGGLIGRTWDGSVTNCYCRGRVIGTDVAGGLIGYNHHAVITNCYSTGPVQATHVGGLIGNNESGANNCYWDVEASRVTQSQGGEARTTRQMTYPYGGETYVEWDFEEIWRHDADRTLNDGYPVFFHQAVDPPVELNAPVVKIEKIIAGGEDRIKLYWEAVTGANSYLIYSSPSLGIPLEDWGEPIAIGGETSYIDEIDESLRRFYYVVASTNEPPGD